MRTVIQRVIKGKVTVEDEVIGEIGAGLVVLLGVGVHDTAEDCVYLAQKLVNLRIFEDENEKLNLSILDRQLPVLIVSQFTLFGDCRNGRRPSFTEAAPPEKGEIFYEMFCNEVAKLGITVAKGRFRSHMLVEICNDGPVTILMDSQKTF